MSNDLKIEPLYSIFASLEGRAMARRVHYIIIIIYMLCYAVFAVWY